MATAAWTTKAWNAIVTKYPKLEGKSEGVAFCAWAIDQGTEALTEVRAFAEEAGAHLKFSGASIGGAKVAMGKAKKKARKSKTKAKAAPRGRPRKGAKKRGRPEKKRGGSPDVKFVIASLLEDLAADVEEANVEYESGRERLLAAKVTFKKLRPVFDEYHAAKSKKIGALLDSVR
jgi:hypothetical protein